MKPCVWCDRPTGNYYRFDMDLPGLPACDREHWVLWLFQAMGDVRGGP